MESFLTLLLAHLIADFPLQTDGVYRFKARSWVGVAVHSLIHVLAAMLLVRGSGQYLPAWIFLLVTHFLTDFIKLRVKTRLMSTGFLVDQLAHLVVVILIAAWHPGMQSVLPTWLLLVALAYAWVPATLMFLWVYSNDLAKDAATNQERAAWMQQNLLRFSQVSGYPLVALVAAGLAGSLLV
jgi:hypothetical protein